MIGSLSTPTLLKTVTVSENWDEQKEMLAVLRDRSDLFNLEPVLQVAVDPRHHFTVRRAAVECAATHNPQLALARMTETAENRFLNAEQREAALHNLAALQVPHRTLPVLERVGMQSGPTQVRCTAIKLVGKFRNVRSIDILRTLARDRDPAVANQARLAFDELVLGNGGIRQVVEKLMARADNLAQNGKIGAARNILRMAAELDPRNGRLLYRLARASVA